MAIVESLLCELLPWFEKHPRLATWISTIATFFTFIVAWKALETWKNQKEFELLIDNLSNLNFARDYIIKLRLLFTSDINAKELENEIEKTNIEDQTSIHTKRVAIIQIRQKRNQDLKEKFLVLRERNAVYGKKNDFYIFYNRIIELDSEILDNAVYISNLRESYESLHDLEFKAEYEKVKPIIFFQKGDQISKEIDDTILKLENQYRIKRSFLF